MAVLVPLASQVYQVQRETLVCPVRLAPLGSLAPKERLDSLVTPAPQGPRDLPAAQVCLCRGRKGCRDLPDLPEEQVPPVHRVHVVQQAAAESKGKRASPEPQEPQVSPDRKERQETPASRVRLVCRVVLGRREIWVCPVYLDSPDQRETLEFLVRVDFLETVETLVLLVFPGILGFPQRPSW